MRCASFALTVALAAGLSASATDASRASCAPPTEADVAELFNRWSAALETVHPDRVLRLYAADALLLPLAANGARQGAAEIRDYYVYFLQREPRVAVETRSVRADCALVTDAGIYEMKARTRAGKAETFRVRYSLTWQKQDRGWQIVHEHASIGPDKGTPDRAAIGPVDPLAVPVPVAATEAIKPKVAGFVKRVAKSQARAPQPKATAPKGEAAARRDIEFDAR